MTRSTMWVAMSGGVDSSVAAALSLDSGEDVLGVSLRLSDDTAAIESAAGVARALGIPHRVIDARSAFEKRVVSRFAEAFAAGVTPNPCVTCNDEIKFGLLLDAAVAAGATTLATGHYARRVETPAGVRIGRARDLAKDQSYFLYRLSPASLERVSFPLGEHMKAEVRAIASRRGIPSAERPESQDACFLGGADAGSFVAARAPGAGAPGPILDTHGRVLGRHQGICRYTVGQRRGLPGGGGAALHVVAIDAARNAVIVGPRSRCERTRVTCSDIVWHDTGDGGRYVVMVRARMAPVPAAVQVSAQQLTCILDQAVCAAPGQAVVCYRDDIVAGGGTIIGEETW